MADIYLRQSALAPLHLLAQAREPVENTGLTIGERGFRAQWVVRGDADNEILAKAVKEVTGSDLPTTPNTSSSTGYIDILWQGPDEWLVVAPDGSDAGPRLADACQDIHVAVTDVSESRTLVVLAGDHARDVLAKGCALDLHPRSFATGQCAQSMLGHIHIILHQKSDAPEYDVYVHRSFAESLWMWLEDAAAEYNPAIANPA
jgi:sarcosine oxidase, subunit gamma